MSNMDSVKFLMLTDTPDQCLLLTELRTEGARELPWPACRFLAISLFVFRNIKACNKTQ